MAHKAKDGTEYTNRMMVNKHNARMDSKQPETPSNSDSQNGAQPNDSPTQDSPENPDVDQHVDALLASGMSPDEIHEAAKKRSGHSQEQEPAQQPSALSSIPGM